MIKPQHKPVIFIFSVIAFVVVAMIFQSYITPRPSEKTVPADGSIRARANALMTDAAEQQKQGNAEEAGILVDKAIAADNSWSVPRFAKGQLLITQGKEPEAVALLEETAKLFPKDPEAGLILLRTGMTLKIKPEYEEIARKVIALKPDSGEAHFYLAQTIISTGNKAKFEEAKSELEKAAVQGKGQPNIPVEKAHLAILMSDFGNAIPNLNEALDLVTSMQGKENPIRIVINRRDIALYMSQAYAGLKDAANQKTWADKAAKMDEKIKRVEALKNKLTGKTPDMAAQTDMKAIMDDPTFPDY